MVQGGPFSLIEFVLDESRQDIVRLFKLLEYFCDCSRDLGCDHKLYMTFGNVAISNNLFLMRFCLKYEKKNKKQILYVVTGSWRGEGGGARLVAFMPISIRKHNHRL